MLGKVTQKGQKELTPLNISPLQPIYWIINMLFCSVTMGHISNSVIASYLLSSINKCYIVKYKHSDQTGSAGQTEFIQQWLPLRINLGQSLSCLCLRVFSFSCLVCLRGSNCSNQIQSPRSFFAHCFLSCLLAAPSYS